MVEGIHSKQKARKMKLKEKQLKQKREKKLIKRKVKLHSLMRKEHVEIVDKQKDQKEEIKKTI